MPTKKNDVARRKPADGEAVLARLDSLSLDELARHANAEAREAENRALYHACRAGIFLLEARERCEQDGTGWYEWLAEEWHYSRQHADRFMALAEACDRTPARVASLEAKSIRGALAAIGKPADGARKSESPTRKPLENNDSDRSRVSASPVKENDVTDAEFTVVAPAASQDDDDQDDDQGEGDFPIDEKGDLERAKGEGWCGCKHAFLEHGGRIAATGHAYYLGITDTACRVAGCGCRSFHYAPAGTPAPPALPVPTGALPSPAEGLPPPADDPCEDCGRSDHATGADVCRGVPPDDDELDDYVDPDPRELALHTLERRPLDVPSIFLLLHNSPSPLPGFVGPHVLGRDVSHVQHVMALLREVWSQLDFKLQHKQFKSSEDHRLMAALRDRLSDCCTMAEEAVTRRHGQAAEDQRRADAAAAKRPAAAEGARRG